MASDSRQVLNFEFSDDSKRPVLLGWTYEPEGLNLLIDVFKSLATGQTDCVELHQLPNVEITGAEAITLRLQPPRRGRFGRAAGTIQINVEAGETAPVIDWRASCDDWEDNISFVESLLQGGGGGHQYLSSEISLTEVVISYGGPWY